MGDAVATATVTGPAWSTPGLNVFTGRFPLSVEAHTMNLIGSLVPGVTTLTPHARYYAVHAVTAAAATDDSLDDTAAVELLRRCEVVVAGVSILHDHTLSGIPRAHGADVIVHHLGAGTLDVAGLQVPGRGRYVRAERGFWPPYAGSEVTLGVLASSTALQPGERCDLAAARAGLGGLVELARNDTVTVDELAAHGHLCVCAGRDSPDGDWLRHLLCAPTPADGFSHTDRARTATVRLLARTVDVFGPVPSFADAFLTHVAFGSFAETDPVASNLEVTEAWQGLLLRHFSVGSWRRLWSWLVAQVHAADHMAPDELIDIFAAQLPDQRVATFVAGLPDVTIGGYPAPAERVARDDAAMTVPERELSVLAVGSARVSQLTGRTLAAFVGKDHELAPRWLARRFEAQADRHLRDFGRDLAADMLVRARRIAAAKMRRVGDQLALPTRLHERGGLLWATGLEGDGDVGLRVDQLGTVLAGAAVFDHGPAGWTLTDTGRTTLAE